MSDIMELLKPKLDGMHEMYKAGYESGKRDGKIEAYKELLEDIKLWEIEIEKCRPA